MFRILYVIALIAYIIFVLLKLTPESYTLHLDGVGSACVAHLLLSGIRPYGINIRVCLLLLGFLLHRVGVLDIAEHFTVILRHTILIKSLIIASTIILMV